MISASGIVFERVIERFGIATGDFAIFEVLSDEPIVFCSGFSDGLGERIHSEVGL